MGLPVESTVGDFIRLFPDVDDSSGPELARSDEQESADGQESAPLALTFGHDGPDRFAETRRRLGAAVVDLAAVMMGSTAVALTLPVSFWTAATVMALSYYSLGVVLLGHSFGAHWLVPESRNAGGKLLPGSRQFV